MKEINDITIEKIRYKYITVLFVLVICVPFLFVLFGESKTYSNRENRALDLFPKPSVSDFFEGHYQVAIEGAFKDQMFGSDAMKYYYNQYKSFSTVSSFKVFQALFYKADEIYKDTSLVSTDQTNSADQNTIHDDDNTSNHDSSDVSEVAVSFSIEDWGYQLTVMNDIIIRINETNHLVLEGKSREVWEPLITAKVNNINEFSEIFVDQNIYAYYVETDLDVDLIGKKNTHEITGFIESGLSHKIQFAYLKIDSLTNFDRFFISDHHWNEKGQLEGYQSIATLLGKGYNPEAKAITFDGSQYIGSRGRRLDSLNYVDVFGTVAIPDLKFDIYVNGELSQYNNKSNYLLGNYTKEIDYNHYVSCNGYDEALLHYDFSKNEANKDEGNLLIFVDSFSNPINELIASHYQHTYVIDLRHWERDFQEAFDIHRFMAEQEIDDVLFLGYYVSYAAQEFLVPLE